MKALFVGAVALAMGGCARSATMPLSADTIQIITSTAPVCGRTGAQNVALRRAAIETINRGFDRLLIVGSQYQNNVGVVGYTPVQAHTISSATAAGYGNVVTAHGQSSTYYSGGQPIITGLHEQGLIVKMFREGDPAGANGIDARAQLGPKWQEVIKENAATTC